MERGKEGEGGQEALMYFPLMLRIAHEEWAEG